MELEYKSAAAEFKASAEYEGEYEGYFAVTENVDDGGDMLHKGAFRKTLQEAGRKVRVLWGHDPLQLAGPPPAELSEDGRGLYAKGRLTLESAAGRNVWALLKDGALDEGSIGYRSIPARTEWKDGVRHLYEVKLFEISFVSMGMNPATAIRALKAWSAGGGSWGLYLEILQRVATGLESAADLEAPDLDTCRSVRDALGLAMAALDRMCAAAAPAETIYLGHSALQLKERAARLGLSLIQ